MRYPNHFPGDLALVERILAFRRDRTHRGREIGIAEDGAHGGGLSVHEKDPGGIRVPAERGLHALDALVQRLGDDESFFGILNRWRQHVGERHRPLGLEQLHQAGERAGSGQLHDAVGFVNLLAAVGEFGCDRRAGGPVQSLDLAGLAVAEDREAFSADARATRLDDAHHRGDGDGGIEGIAPSLEDLNPDLRCDGMCARDHPVAAHHRRIVHFGPDRVEQRAR